jgi:pimeloyl-[acyl-carrier protein] methyl ester esterase
VSALYYEVHGEGCGRDLVLLHGWSMNLRVWDGLVRALVPQFRVIAVDLPGHGASSWDAQAATPAAQAWRVHETLAPLTERYALLGWSLGGQLALDLAAALPAAIERLALIATTPKFLASPSWRCGTPRPLLARLVHRLHAEGERAVQDFLLLQTRGCQPGTAVRVLAKLRAALRSHGEACPEALAAGLARLREGDLRAALPLVRVPALVMAGQRDRVIRAVASRKLARALPQARYVEIAGAAHAPFLSHPVQFLHHLQGFLA